MSSESPDQIHQSVDHLFRHRAGQMVATLTRIFGIERLDLVEDAVQDALVQALRLWPYRGIPDNPSAWLIEVAKNRMLDSLRRDRRTQEIPDETEFPIEEFTGETGARFASEIRDDQLRMIFTCCHPLIPSDGQIALTLKTVGGFSVSEIARAFLAQEPAIAKTLVRAKQRLREFDLKLEMPQPDKLPARLESVLKVLYLMFNEGYSALEGEELVRTDLCHEAIRLCELLAEHPVTGEPKVHALAALLLFQGARLNARCDAAGELMLLAEQDRSLWNQTMLRRGLHHFQKSASGDELSDYHLEAEIASCHVVAESFEATDWPRVLDCYEQLLNRQPSPIVALNRIVALAKVHGVEVGLVELDKIAEDRTLRNYYPFFAARGELLREAGRTNEAIEAYQKALGLTSSEPIRRFLIKRIPNQYRER
ncbi:MAG: sigma-70 family RNA polymerase sigma factor [Acidobacteria bacterium]|nr:sigma-70 family RNA polymerase sigma factor [Acidobacteriota bacterium]